MNIRLWGNSQKLEYPSKNKIERGKTVFLNHKMKYTFHSHTPCVGFEPLKCMLESVEINFVFSSLIKMLCLLAYIVIPCSLYLMVSTVTFSFKIIYHSSTNEFRPCLAYKIRWDGVVQGGLATILYAVFYRYPREPCHFLNKTGGNLGGFRGGQRRCSEGRKAANKI